MERVRGRMAARPRQEVMLRDETTPRGFIEGMRDCAKKAAQRERREIEKWIPLLICSFRNTYG